MLPPPFPRDSSWNVLLGDARLRISDFTWFPLRFFSCCLTPTNSGVRLCFRLRCLPSSPHHCHRCCLLESQVLSSLHSSRRPCQFILRRRLKVMVSSPALCPAQFSSEYLARDASDDTVFSMPLIPGSLAACRSTAPARARLDSCVSRSRSQSCGPRRVAFQQDFDMTSL